MAKARGREHTTMTETTTRVVRVLAKLPGIKMIAPGEIKTNSRKGTGQRFVTAVYTNAGMELIISGQSVQKIAVHTVGDPKEIFTALQSAKALKDVIFKARSRV